MRMWVRFATLAALLCPLLAAAEKNAWQPPQFVAGREYHTGHSARPHKIKKERKRSAQHKDKQSKQTEDKKP